MRSIRGFIRLFFGTRNVNPHKEKQCRASSRSASGSTEHTPSPFVTLQCAVVENDNQNPPPNWQSREQSCVRTGYEGIGILAPPTSVTGGYELLGTVGIREAPEQLDAILRGMGSGSRSTVTTWGHEAVQQAASRLGITDLRGWQHDALDAWAAGRDCLILAGTGSGKSACFQIPPLLDSRPSSA